MKGEFIGEGRFARVYSGISNKLQGKLALRVLKCTEIAAISQKKLQYQASFLVSLKHENVVQCYGLILEEATFIHEFCQATVDDGNKMLKIHSLLGLLRTFEDDMPAVVRLKAISDVGSGLSFLHNAGIVVGDLKPSNVLACDSGSSYCFKISDINFGPGILQNDSMLSCGMSMNMNEVAFTLLYLAPELVGEDMTFSKQTAASDIYSFGILIYEVLFPEITLPVFASLLQHMNAIRNQWRPQIPESSLIDVFCPNIWNCLISIVRKCWSSIPRSRPNASDIYQLAQDLTASIFQVQFYLFRIITVIIYMILIYRVNELINEHLLYFCGFYIVSQYGSND